MSLKNIIIENLNSKFQSYEDQSYKDYLFTDKIEYKNNKYMGFREDLLYDKSYSIDIPNAESGIFKNIIKNSPIIHVFNELEKLYPNKEILEHETFSRLKPTNKLELFNNEDFDKGGKYYGYGDGVFRYFVFKDSVIFEEIHDPNRYPNKY